MTLAPVKSASGETDWDATQTKVQEAYADWPDAESGPAWKSALNTLKFQERERELLAEFGNGEFEASTELLGSDIPTAVGPGLESTDIPGLRLADWVTSIFPGAPHIVNEDRAKVSPCLRIPIGDGYYLVKNDWIAGWLSPEQEDEFCKAGVVDLEVGTDQQVQIRAYAEAARSCSIQANQDPDIFFSCLGKELRKAEVNP